MKYCLLLALTLSIAQATSSGLTQVSPQVLAETTRSLPQTTHSQQLSTPPQTYTLARSSGGQQFPQYPSSQRGYISGRSEYPESYSQDSGASFYSGDQRDQRDAQYSRDNIREPQYSVRGVDAARDVREPQYSVRPVDSGREPQYTVRPVDAAREPQYSVRPIDNVNQPLYLVRADNRPYITSYNQQYKPLQYGRGHIAFTAPLANTRSFTQFEPIGSY